MPLRDLVYRIAVRLNLRHPVAGAARFLRANDAAAAWAQRTSSPLAKRFLAHKGRVAHKWVHYLEVYEPFFARFVGRDVRLLELGVSQGGSLELWREWFGPQATIFGIDVDPACAVRVDPPNQVRIGSQADTAFLRGVVAEMGGLDIVIDDGSHVGRDQHASFSALFPLLSDGGLYVIEDLHTSYWPGGYEGGHKRPGTGIELLKELIDAMHACFHEAGSDPAGTWIPALHVFNWTAVIEKRRRGELGHFKVGGTKV